MLNRKLSLKAIIVLFISLVTLSACSNSNNQEISQRKVIKIGTTSQSFPNSYRESGELVGFDVEIAEMVAKNLDYEIEWVITDFSGLMGQLASNQIDTVANQVAITEERANEYQFTVPYAYAGVTIVTHEVNSYNNLSDLEGKKVGGVLGSENVQSLSQAKPNIEVTTYQTRESAVNDTVMKRIEGYVNLEPNLIASINKDNLPLKFVGDPFEYQEIAFPFSEKNADLKDAFSLEIEKFREEGKLKELSEKYYYRHDISEKGSE